MPSSEKKPEPKVTGVTITDLSNAKKGAEGTTYVPPGGTVTRVGGQNIVSVEVQKEHVVRSFEAGKLHDTKGVRYSDVRDGSVGRENVKNQRFKLSDLARGPLSVEMEEEQRIAVEVQRRLEFRLEELREQARREAYEAGYAKGLTDGKAEVFAHAKPMLDKFNSLLAALEGMKFEVFKANEELLVRMVYRLAKAVILRELKDDIDYTKRLVVQLLERLGTRENIRIFVGEEEYSSAETLKQGLAESLGELKNISVEVSPDVTQKGCRLETDFGEVDARIEIQMQNIAAALGTTNTS